MYRSTLASVFFCVALLIGTGAFAQVPPDPNNPNEAVPDAMPFNIPYGETIDIATAKKVAGAAVAEAAKRHWLMCIAVVGPSGDLIYFERMDNCQIASIEISLAKARASARFRRPTVIFERLRARGDNFAYLPTLGAGFIASRGGNPIVVGGKLIGAIGVSGGTGSQDDVISQAGATAVK